MRNSVLGQRYCLCLWKLAGGDPANLKTMSFNHMCGWIDNLTKLWKKKKKERNWIPGPGCDRSCGSQLGASLHPTRQVAMSADIFGCNPLEGGCFWNLVGGAQGCPPHPTVQSTAPPNRVTQPQRSVVLRLGTSHRWEARCMSLGSKVYMNSALTSEILISLCINNLNW